ncbi:MAG: CHAD domain-containing protein [Gemmatimonadota bacterium]
MTARPSTDTGLLHQRARGAAAAIARVRLERAMEKAAPLLVAVDADAAATIGNDEVHAFRVALRRLRSWLRASDRLLRREVARDARSALRRLARCAGAARDAQVHWKWFTAPSEPRGAPATRAALWLAGEQLALYAAERERLHHKASERWPRLATTLAESLAAHGDAEPPGPDNTLAEHLAPALSRDLELARRALDRIEHPTQVAVIHRARIKVKRLRYLLEAIEHRSPHRARALKQLRLLQDTLGELHDAHEMSALLTPLLVPHRRLRRAPVRRPPLRDLRALRAALRRRELAAFRRSLDLAGSLEVERAWQYIASLAIRLGAPRESATQSPRPANARPDR